MKRLTFASLLVLAIVLLSGGVALAQSAPEFKLGFKALADQLPAEVLGTPVENEYFNLSNGNSEQHTTVGLMVWRKADNWTAYTNGYMTWINGPDGMQSRLNSERFDWEKDLPASQPAPAQPRPAPVEVTWRMIDRSADGFKISLPSTWQQVDLNSPDPAGDLKKVLIDYPDSTELADRYALAAGIVKLTKGVFFAFPVTPELVGKPGSTTAKILKVNLPSGTTLDELSAQVADVLSAETANGTATVVSRQRVSLPAGDAQELVFTQKVKLGVTPEITAGVVEFLFVHNGYMYDMVFVSISAAGSDELKRVYKVITDSFRFTN